MRKPGDSVRRVPIDDPKQLVQRGYDALSRHYELAYPTDTKYRPWITDLSGRLSAGSAVLFLARRP